MKHFHTRFQQLLLAHVTPRWRRAAPVSLRTQTGRRRVVLEPAGSLRPEPVGTRWKPGRARPLLNQRPIIQDHPARSTEGRKNACQQLCFCFSVFPTHNFHIFTESRDLESPLCTWWRRWTTEGIKMRQQEREKTGFYILLVKRQTFELKSPRWNLQFYRGCL